MVVVAEAEVVRAAQDGDRAAFGELYNTYLPKIYDFALGMLRNKADAEDVTSDTFLKTVERLGTLKEPEAFRGWLYTIARNSALSLIETRKRAVPTADHDEGASTLDTAVMPDPETGAESDELRELVWDAAATLNPRDFQVFELTVRHGLSSSEIAPILGVRPAYAYILVNRLKGSVEEALETVLLTRTGRTDCSELDSLVVAYGEEPTARMRKAVARHAKDCTICVETKRSKASVPVVLAGMAFAAPSAAFAAELAAKIDEAWPPSSTGGSNGSGSDGGAGRTLSQLAGFTAAVIVVAGTFVGLSARPINDAAPLDMAPVVEASESTPKPKKTAKPTEAPVDQPVTGPREPVATPAPVPANTPTVVIVDGSDSGTVDTGDENENDTVRTPPPTQPDPEPDPGKPNDPPRPG